jgi:hypothetical protein
MSRVSRFVLGALVFGGVASLGAAQNFAPWARPADLLLSDTGADVIYRLADQNLDGDYLDAGEVSTFFATGAQGVTISLSAVMAVGPDGAVFLADTTTDLLYRFVDLNADGDALDAGEQTLWFGSTGSAFPNASGIAASSMLGLAVDGAGAVYFVNPGTSAAPTDYVAKLVDLNADGDAQDAGEAIIYTTISTSTAGNASNPSSIAIGPNGIVYYGESGVAAGVGRGVWRLEDLNFDGDADDVSEKTLYFQPSTAAAASTVAYYGLAFDATGRLYLTDHLSDDTWVATDLNNDQVITNGTGEDVLFFNPGAASLEWSMAVGQDLNGNAVLLIADDQAPERIRALSDANFDGDAMDAGEVALAYDETLGSQLIDTPRAIAFMKGPSLAAGPLPVQLGQNFTVLCSGGGGEVFVVDLGLPLGFNLPVAPFGVLTLDPTPGTYFDLVPPFVLPPSGEQAFVFPIPNFAPLLGVTLQLQGVGGSMGKLFFTNGIMLTFQ